MNSLLFLFIVSFFIGLFAIYKILELITNVIFEYIMSYLDALIEKSSNNEEIKNTVLSVLYFFRDMGPNVSSFAIIAMIVTTSDTAFQLTIVFVLGIILKEVARFLTKRFMKLVNTKGVKNG